MFCTFRLLQPILKTLMTNFFFFQCQTLSSQTYQFPEKGYLSIRQRLCLVGCQQAVALLLDHQFVGSAQRPDTPNRPKVNCTCFFIYCINFILSIRVVDFLGRCQNPRGGFGGGPGQLAHLAPTYASINTLMVLGTKDAYSMINRFEKIVTPHLPNMILQRKDVGLFAADEANRWGIYDA